MKHFRILNTDGNAVYEYNNDERIAFDLLWPEPPHTQIEVSDPAVEPAPEPAPSPVKITKLAFRNRFTQAEKVSIEIASLDVPTSPMQQRAMAAALRANQADVAVAMYIDLTRADTRGGVQALEAAGLLAAGRAAQILDTPPTDEEWYG